MLEAIFLGTIQGITEWLPISSEGFLILAKVQLFQSSEPLQELVKISLFLHLGTFLAALFYFWEDIKMLTNRLIHWGSADTKEKNTIKFLLIATIITGIIAGLLLVMLHGIEERFEVTGKSITALIGVLLLGTGYLQLRTKKIMKQKNSESPSMVYGKKEDDLKVGDSILLGFMQGFAILPGFSRSGLTVAGLLLRKFGDETALRLSFLMSLPVVLAGNIFLNIDKFRFDTELFWGLLTSFIFGYITIHGLLKIARRINFSYFILFFGALMVLAALI